MSRKLEKQADRIRARRKREEQNIFSRLPALYAASRTQGLGFLQSVGGLSIVEWRVLWDLSEAGPMTIKDLAELQRTDHSLLSRALPRMRDKGFVSLEKDETDGRQTIVAIAPAGAKAYQRAAPTMQKRREALRQEFTAAEISELCRYFDRLDTFLRRSADELLNEDHQK